MIRIIHVIGNLRLGGGQKLTYSIVEGLSQDRFHVSVCCLEEGSHYGDLLKEKGRNVFEFGGRKDYRLGGLIHSSVLLHRMIKLFQIEKPDIVHTHLFGAGIVGRVAARACGVPVIVTTLHRIFYPYIQPSVEKFLSWWTDSIVVDSNAVGELVRRKCHIDARKIKVIYNGIETKEFEKGINRTDARRSLQLPGTVCNDKVPLIGIVAHLLPHKGQKFFIEALYLLRKRGIPAHLLLVGDGPQRKELESQARELGIGDAVSFAGYRSDLNIILSGLDLLVLPSEWEGFGLILAEAMYMRIPVISTDHGGSQEVVSQFETGLLVPFGDVNRLAGAATLILENSDFAQRMGEKGRDRVIKMFTKETMVSQYEALYESLLSVG